MNNYANQLLSAKAGLGINIILCILMGLILQGIIVAIVIYVIKYLKKEKQRKKIVMENFENNWSSNNLTPKIIVNKGRYVLITDEAKGKWSNGWSEPIYDVNDIKTASIIRPFSRNKEKVYGQYVVVHCYSNSSVSIGECSHFDYAKTSFTFKENEKIVNQIINEITKLQESAKMQKMANEQFLITEEIQYQNSFFCYDIDSKRFCVRADCQEQCIYNFTDLMDYYLDKNEEKISKGSYFSIGGVGSMDVNTNRFCYNMSFIIKVRDGQGVNEIEYKMLDNGMENTNSYQYQNQIDFVDKLTRILKYIEKNK